MIKLKQRFYRKNIVFSHFKIQIGIDIVLFISYIMHTDFNVFVVENITDVLYFA